MKKLYWALGAVVALVVLFFAFNAFIYNQKQGTGGIRTGDPEVKVLPIQHATAVITWDEVAIYLDPTGDAAAFEGKPDADIVLVTDIHRDHFSTSTLEAVSRHATLIVPQEVMNQLPPDLAKKARVLGNGEATTELDFSITGVPMYNLETAANATYHTKGRGNGYLIERDGFRLYIAGDTAATPEFRGMTDIDLALVPMNLPFTMTVEEAAAGVVEMNPIEVMPYHYRNQDETLSDISLFRRLVNQGNREIDVTNYNWYQGI